MSATFRNETRNPSLYHRVEPASHSNSVDLINGTFWNLFTAWSSNRIAGGIARDGRVAAWLNRSIGAFFVAMGVRLALFERG